MNQNEELKHEVLRALLDEISRFAPEFPLYPTRDLMRVGEFKIAVENLCTNLYEEDVILPKEIQRRLVDVAREFKVSRRYWAHLFFEEASETDK